MHAQIHSLGRAKLDLDALLRVDTNYQPRAIPSCLVIGPGGEKEASAIKEFHRQRYGISPSDVYIAGVSLAGVSAARGNDHYDFLLGASYFSDLSKERSWEYLCEDVFQQHEGRLDLIWIRNPEFEFAQNWIKILAYGTNCLAQSGIFVMIVRDDDLKHVEPFLVEAQKSLNIKPTQDLPLDCSHVLNHFGTHARLLVFAKADYI